MIRQLSLFDDYSVDDYFRHNIQRNDYKLEELDIGDITFAGGQKESIHRWYRLTPSFSPALVRYFIKYCSINNNSLVLDPFSGRGTTIIECKKNHIPSIGFEINPLLEKVGNYSLIWSKENLELLKKTVWFS